MIYIILSIICSVIVSVMLKLAKRYEIDVRQAITYNYSIAIILTWIFLKPDFMGFNEELYYLYIPLGVLLPAIFLVIALSVRFTGIARTESAQRLSLFIPLIASFMLFEEIIHPQKAVAIVLGLVAVIMLLPYKKPRVKSRSAEYWFYPVLTFLGFGMIDILFKKVALVKEMSFAGSLFIIYLIALVISSLVLMYLFIANISKFSWKNVVCGLILGIFNFGNILFYIKAHQSFSDNPSLVFSTMNVGVIVLGSLIGLFIFKERLSLLNKAGILVAIVALIVFYKS